MEFVVFNSLRRPVRNLITISHLDSFLLKMLQRFLVYFACQNLLAVYKTFDPKQRLSHFVISFKADKTSIIIVNIKARKTDHFHAGVVVRLTAILDRLLFRHYSQTIMSLLFQHNLSAIFGATKHGNQNRSLFIFVFPVAF